ncbi:MAG: hypothetical protein RMZ69_21530 [Nostoc sp. ChiQUE01a]|nr:hypothetical protein [Nostoc sp. ChiQUE01a]
MKKSNTNSINDYNTSLVQDAMNRVSTIWCICDTFLDRLQFSSYRFFLIKINAL